MRLINLIIKSKVDKFVVYNVGSGNGTQIKKLLEKIKFYFNFTDKMIFNGKKSIAENQNYISSNKKVENEFKWKPIYKLNLELKKYVNWFKKIKH